MESLSSSSPLKLCPRVTRPRPRPVPAGKVAEHCNDKRLGAREAQVGQHPRPACLLVGNCLGQQPTIVPDAGTDLTNLRKA